MLLILGWTPNFQKIRQGVNYELPTGLVQCQALRNGASGFSARNTTGDIIICFGFESEAFFLGAGSTEHT